MLCAQLLVEELIVKLPVQRVADIQPVLLVLIRQQELNVIGTIMELQEMLQMMFAFQSLLYPQIAKKLQDHH
jgi:hypothetical protein